MEENDDDSEMMMRRGLVDYCDLRGCGTGSTGASSGCLEEHHEGAEGYNNHDDEESNSLLVSAADVRQCAHLLSEESGITCNNHDGDNDNMDMMQRSQCCQLIMSRARSNPSLSLAATILIGICTIYLLTSEQFHNINLLRTTNYIRSKTHQFGVKMRTSKQNITFQPHPRPLENIIQYPQFPATELLGITVNSSSSTIAEDSSIDPPYNPSDFQYQNEAGRNRTLTYWEEVVAAIEEFQEVNYTSSRVDGGSRLIQEEDGSNTTKSSIVTTPWANITSWGPCFPRALPMADDQQVRSLLRKKKNKKPKQVISQNWTDIVQNNDLDSNDDTRIYYPIYRRSYSNDKEEYLGGLCRPGFLIIGQGKCGTSSLYQYLTGHDRVLPAVKKQIHYFIFNTKKSLKWYYSNFPTIESFLGTGTLMTGEASPGYMPYPSVIELLVKRLSPTQPNKLSADRHGLEAYRDSIRSLPKIISVVRDPIERAISSYKYNYIVPALTRLKRGQGMTASGKQIPGGRTEQFYRDYLYTFEEMASAELVTLKKCLEPGGRGETYSYNRHGMRGHMFFHGTFESRANSSKTPLINLDGACYEATTSKSVPRVQWNVLAERNPEKILDIPNLQLTQSIVGRGIYVFPLEWWYEVFASANVQREDWIHTVCTEEMSDNAVDAMDDVTSFLGLPEFDFQNTTSVGRYNVGGHRGYDTVTTVDEESDETDEPITTQESKSSPPDLTAISDELMTELLEFYRPYNERLFELIGKRCAWKE